ncbi:hypothetical protein [Lihuaxuella thermophila]|uniref:hypothetical protein n=1 Tax=Lihuaxuella thermophila TaxID=1173111 RepID=UPI0011146B70|nr:hypothetical protein [Lihuaxuella thermophila]
MLKKKASLLLCLILAVAILGGCSRDLPEVKVDGQAYIYRGKHYTEAFGLEVPLSDIGEEIGITPAGRIVCAIKGVPTDQWIAIKEEAGFGSVYKEQNIGAVDVKEFAPVEIEVFAQRGRGERGVIRDMEKIDRLVKIIMESRPVSVPKKMKVSRFLQLKSKKYKTIRYILTYIEDLQGRRYIEDERTGKVYEIGTLLEGEIR